MTLSSAIDHNETVRGAIRRLSGLWGVAGLLLPHILAVAVSIHLGVDHDDHGHSEADAHASSLEIAFHGHGHDDLAPPHVHYALGTPAWLVAAALSQAYDLPAILASVPGTSPSDLSALLAGGRSAPVPSHPPPRFTILRI